MNRVDVRAKVREITELTEDDVADTVIDWYARDGFERIMALERRWPFFETSSTLAVVAADSEYPISGIASDTIRELVSLVNSSDGSRLQQISYEEGERFFGPFTASGAPRCWTLWAQTVKLWPTPDTNYTLNLRGYRKYTEWWESDAAEIDCDERLHIAVVYYVISRLYQLQEDPEMSSFYAQTFAEAVQVTAKEIMRMSSSRPLILNEGTRYTHSPLHRYFHQVL